ncbi:hypothetical protein [Bacillus sp. FJAT-27231]|uniref:hypothetical protein n=1 Tax=Bacillus sp. FJAT-27231 TaxID=1679168 RepID=UPI0012E22FD3|nr:hypothetical protein [Bacillus sp. FJAT-27231]
MIDDSEAKRQSVPFFFPVGGHTQAATVQYKGHNGEMIEGVVLRFYVRPFQAADLLTVVEEHIDFRTELKEGEASPYYEYIFKESYFHPDVHQAISKLFVDLARKKSRLLAGVESERTPNWITDLPR